MSITTHLRGLAWRALRCCSMLSPDAVTVWPNMIWPTSIETLGERSTASAMRSAPEENLRSPSVRVAVELHVREMDRPAFGGIDRRQRAVDVAGHAEVAGVHVQRMRHAQLVHGAAQRRDHLARRDAVVHVRLVHVQLALVELEGADAAGIHHLDGDGLRGVQRPGHVVVDLRLARSGGEQPQEEVVVAEQRVGALVDDRRVAHLHVGLARVGRQHRRLEAGGVAHGGVAVAGRQRRRRRAAEARAAHVGGRQQVAAVDVGQHGAREIDLAAADMRVQVDGAGHRDLAGHVVGAIDALAVARPIDDAPVADEQIAHHVVDPVGRVDDARACELGQHDDRDARPAAHAARPSRCSSRRYLRDGRQRAGAQAPQVQADDLVGAQQVTVGVDAGCGDGDEHVGLARELQVGAAQHDGGTVERGRRSSDRLEIHSRQSASPRASTLGAA